MQTGDIVSFGVWEQSVNGGDRTPIDWRVLEITDGRALLLTDKAIAYHTFHDKVEKVTWRTCSLRAWLNGAFADTAFSPEERKRLVPFGTEPGLTDEVFCLSAEEAERLLQDRTAAPTEYANAHGTYIPCAKARWWLRSRGFTPLMGQLVDSDGTIFNLGVKLLSIAVRPAVWITVSE